MNTANKERFLIFFELVKLLARITLFVVSFLAALGILVVIISISEQWNTHKRFLVNLEQYGRTTEARVREINNEYGRAELEFRDAQGKERYGYLELRYYRPAVVQTFRPGSTIHVIYIDKRISGMEKTALVEHYAEVRSAPPVTADRWWALGIFWLITVIQPQILFTGIVKPEAIFSSVFKTS